MWFLKRLKNGPDGKNRSTHFIPVRQQSRIALRSSMAAMKLKQPVLPEEKDLAQVAREAGL